MTKKKKKMLLSAIALQSSIGSKDDGNTDVGVICYVWMGFPKALERK